MDQELAAYLDRMSQQIEGLRGEVSQQIEGLRGEMNEFREEVREENRHTRVLMEGFRSDLQLMAEAVMDTRELFKRHESDVERRLNEIKALIPLPYKDLDNRVSILEAKAERQDRDAMEVLREKFGKRQG